MGDMNGQELGVEICRLFGVNPNRCLRLNVHIDNGEALVTFTCMTDDKINGDLLTALKSTQWRAADSDRLIKVDHSKQRLERDDKRSHDEIEYLWLRDKERLI